MSEKLPRALPSWRVFLERAASELIEVPERPDRPLPGRDPDDVHVAAAAMRPEMDCLLTGDKDLLTAEMREALPVYTPAEFLARLHDERQK